MNRTYTGLHYDTMCTHFPTDASLFLIFFFLSTCHMSSIWCFFLQAFMFSLHSKV